MGKVVLIGVAMLLADGCRGGRYQQVNRPLEAAHGTAESTGFGRSTTTSVDSHVGIGSLATTRTGQAASVIDGPRGDRLWRISSDGSFLEFCQFLDEQPYDCDIVPLPIKTTNPTLVEPGNLGGGKLLSANSEDELSMDGETVSSGSLRTTPRFGVWVLTNPTVSVVTLMGVVETGSGLVFCSLDDAGRPRCIDTTITVSRAVSLHTLDVSPASTDEEGADPIQRKFLHVLWGQPVGEGIAIRCEADEESGIVKCEKAKEREQP